MNYFNYLTAHDHNDDESLDANDCIALENVLSS